MQSKSATMSAIGRDDVFVGGRLSAFSTHTTEPKGYGPARRY